MNRRTLDDEKQKQQMLENGALLFLISGICVILVECLSRLLKVFAVKFKKFKIQNSKLRRGKNRKKNIDDDTFRPFLCSYLSLVESIIHEVYTTETPHLWAAHFPLRALPSRAISTYIHGSRTQWMSQKKWCTYVVWGIWDIFEVSLR